MAPNPDLDATPTAPVAAAAFDEAAVVDEPAARGEGGVDVSGYVRRARRLADLSQRDLAAAVGIAQPGISRIESGRDPSVSEFEQILATAGLRIVIVDDAGQHVLPMPTDVVRDRAGRRQPAHLDVHAPPESPSTRMLLRRIEPYPRPPWHHRRPERDRLRAHAKHDATVEQLTQRAIAAAKARRRQAARSGLPPPHDPQGWW